MHALLQFEPVRMMLRWRAPAALAPVLAPVLALMLALMLAGCGTLLRNPVPIDLMPEARIPGMPDVRAWAGQISPGMQEDLTRSFAQESERDFPRDAGGVTNYPHLALSGGGANGAFGAGLLNGWTSTGTRPTFKIVTGVSTGSLLAPLAFLGSSHDEQIRQFYTTVSTRDIFSTDSLLLMRLLLGEALADTGPLANLIAMQVDTEFLGKIAAEHARGRRLYIGTVDLDSQNFVVWNMGRIASYATPEALALFRQVMLASASVPIAFPPTLFAVEAQGRRYDEMHVDGAVGAGVFYNGAVFSFSEALKRSGKGPGREALFIIHNGQLAPRPAATPRRLRPIAARTLAALSLSAIVGDLFRIYTLTRIEGASFHWITMPAGIELTGNEIFDPAKMTELYELGYQRARAGPVWTTRPPHLDGPVP